MPRSLVSLVLPAVLALAGCGDDGGGESAASTESEATGDGDGDPSSTTGDGDGDPATTTGDGDGDGDGDPTTTGDGDGDGGIACETPPWPPASVDDDGYQRFELCGWTVYMNDALYGDALAQPVYDALAEDLLIVTQLLGPSQVEFLRQTNFWLELDHPDFIGGVYHPSAQWLMDNGYPSKWAEGIQLGVAQNYLSWVAQQPAIVLHELSHAWDHQRHGYNHPDVVAAYDAAMAAQLYDEVEYVDGQLLEAYAATNAAEYFAELSEAYFATGLPGEGGWFNDFYPFDGEQLLAHDPVGYAAVEASWSQ